MTLRNALVVTAFFIAPGLFTSCIAAAAAAADGNITALRSALIPKHEVAADLFLKAHPTWDGRGVVIGIFDTGVDPAAAGLAVTSTGERKIVDIIDASGSGDVDTSTKQKPDASGNLLALSGRRLTLPPWINNPSGEYRLGLKAASELFYGEVLKRLTDERAAARSAAASLRTAARDRSDAAGQLKAARAKAPDERSRSDRDQIARDGALTALEDSKDAEATLLYDCVMWHDGTGWRVVVDTNEDGDLANEMILRPFGIAGEFGSFGNIAHANFGVQVYEGGDLLSIVTVSGSHGTHVASIAAANLPDEPARNGIAPGARILSIKIGDIRAGGSSYGTSELRATAIAAQHRVDIVNASWGGRSTLQDGKNQNSRVYDMMVERFDILAVISAGNNGPAFGTAGGAGAEASRVLGVGAYMSREMGKVLYNTLKDTADAAQQFSSRGPTKDGDFGVDVMAPGAAYASLSEESLKRADMFNGTSMASPSAAGVAALVLSAARQNKLAAGPALLRSALILGAQPLPDESVLTRGSGLINAPGAWKKLNDLQSVPAFRSFYDIEVDQGTFTSKGRGLLLRESVDEARMRVGVKITPAWAESTPQKARFSFESDLLLKPSVPWISVPEYVHMTNGPRSIPMLVNVPPVAKGAVGSVHVAQVNALVANQRSLGPVFSIPITIIQPAPHSAFTKNKLETVVALKPSMTQRHFVKAPANASVLRITVKHVAKDSLARRFSVQAVAYAAQTYVASMETVRNLNLATDAEQTFDLKLRPGAVAEVAYTLHFGAVGDASLQTRLEWIGTGVGDTAITVPANAGWAMVTLNPLADRDIEAEAKIDRAIHVFLPESTSELKLDERAEVPASPLTPGPARVHLLRQRFALDFKEGLTAHVLEAQDYDLGDAVGGGRVTLTHESGEVLFDSPGRSRVTGRPPVKFPKGKTTAIVEYTAAESELLKTVVATPLRLSEALKVPRPLPIRASLRDRLFGKDTTELKLKRGREEIVFLQDKAIDELVKQEPKPAHFMGELTLRDSENRVLDRQPIIYIAGASPAKVINADPKAKPVKEERTDVEKLGDTLYDTRLAFVREQRGTTDIAVAARRTEVLLALRSERPADAAIVFEQALDAALAAGLAGESWPKAKAGGSDVPPARETKASAATMQAPAPATVNAERPVLALLDEARRLAGADAVAQYFGAPPAAVSGDLAARPAREREKKRLTGLRETLAKIERLRTDVLRGAGQSDAAWKAFAEIKRWEAEPSNKQSLAIELTLLEQSGLFGLTLDALNNRLKDESANKSLLAQRAALYDKMGWTSHAERERLRLARFEQQRKLAEKL